MLKKGNWWLAGILLVLALAPLAVYWYIAGDCPRVSAAEAKEIVWQGDKPGMLVDVRPAAEYDANHVLGAENWPTSEIATIEPGDIVLKHFADKPLFIMSESGIDGIRAARRLRALSMDAVLVEGGMESWMAEARKPCAAALARGATSEETLKPFYYRPMARYEQWAAVVAALVIKPLYMITALIAFIALWRRKSADLRAIRWAVLFFLIGESACASNFLFFDNSSILTDYIHNVAMPCAFGLAAWAVLEGMEKRLIGYASPDGTCTARPLCGDCVRPGDPSCGLQRLFKLAIPAFLVLSLIPLTVHTRMVSYNTSILGGVYSYSHPMLLQIQEMRYLPLVAAAFFAESFVALVSKKDPVPLSKMLFAVGMGAFGFSMLRTVFFVAWQDNLVWASFWEEATELLFALGVVYTLWVFRRGLYADLPQAVRLDITVGATHASPET